MANDRKIIASEFVALKSRVKAEMKRRAGQGSLTSYARSTYDYSETPQSNMELKREYVDKNLIPIRAINTIDLPEAEPRVLKQADYEAMENKLTTAESYAYQGNTTDCASSCSGLCVGCTGSCSGTCDGCSGSCTGSCSGCSGSCSGSCGGCGGSSCAGGCKAGCTSCEGSCQSSSGRCSSGCTGGSCSGFCQTSSY